MILTIFSLIYMFLLYFGIVRYMKLYITSPQNYIEIYKNLERANENKVIITIMSTTNDFNKIKPVVNSVLDQTVRADKIILLNDKKIDIPIYLKGILDTYIYSENKLEKGIIHVLLNEKYNNTIIFLLNDKIIYGENFISETIDSMEKDNIIYDYIKDNMYTGYVSFREGYFDDYFWEKISQNNKNVIFKNLQRYPHKQVIYKENLGF